MPVRKESEPLHTPTPWAFGNIEDTAICGPTGYVIHRPCNHQTFGIEDLKFIVHAVNLHDDLLKTVNLILRDDKSHIDIETFKKIEKILIKHEGKP